MIKYNYIASIFLCKVTAIAVRDLYDLFMNFLKDKCKLNLKGQLDCLIFYLRNSKIVFRFAEEIGPLSPVAVSLAAGVSGLVAAAASHSLDTAKSRSQCIVLPKVPYQEKNLVHE